MDDDILEEEKLLKQKMVDPEWESKKRLIDEFFTQAAREPVNPPDPVPESSSHSTVFETLDNDEDDTESDDVNHNGESSDTEEQDEPEEPVEQPLPPTKPIKQSMRESPKVAVKEFPPTKSFSQKKPMMKKPGFWLTLLIILLVVGAGSYFVMTRYIPPHIKFVDGNSQEIIHGTVIFNGNEIGEYDGDTFNALPFEFCRNVSELALKQGDEIYKADAYPGDCKSREITYVVNKKEVAVTEIALEFFTEDTGEQLSGQLFIDNESKGDIIGIIKIPVSECKDAKKVKLVTKDNEITWQNDPAKCSEVGTVEFTVPTLKKK